MDHRRISGTEPSSVILRQKVVKNGYKSSNFKVKVMGKNIWYPFKGIAMRNKHV